MSKSVRRLYNHFDVNQEMEWLLFDCRYQSEDREANPRGKQRPSSSHSLKIVARVAARFATQALRSCQVLRCFRTI
jgi:hypothetical protein